MSLYSAEKPAYLNECLSSINDQDSKPIEIVLIIDGPISPDLDAVINQWKPHLNLNIFPLDNNVGLSKALNYGLTKCSHDLVARMDTDDICNPSRLTTQYRFMSENKSVDIVGSYCEDISSDGELLRIRKVPTSHAEIVKNIWACPFIHPSVMFRKNSILNIDIGSYNESAPHRQDDYDLWIRAADSGLIFANIPETLIKYRIPDNAYEKNTFSVGLNRAKMMLTR